jgi:hypothetical protein
MRVCVCVCVCVCDIERVGGGVYRCCRFCECVDAGELMSCEIAGKRSRGAHNGWAAQRQSCGSRAARSQGRGRSPIPPPLKAAEGLNLDPQNNGSNPHHVDHAGQHVVGVEPGSRHVQVFRYVRASGQGIGWGQRAGDRLAASAKVEPLNG